MTTLFFIGIDVSKLTLDFTLIDADGKVLAHFKTKNEAKDIQTKMKQWAKSFGLVWSQVEFCCEYTGLYNRILNQTAASMGLRLRTVDAREVLMSGGRQRGKSDKKDSERLAQYARRFPEKRAHNEINPLTDKTLEDLLALRNRLRTVANQLKVPQQELQKFDPESARIQQPLIDPILTEIKKQAEEVEKAIDQKLTENPTAQKQMELLTSIPGIGRITALYLIVYTRGFTRFPSAKALACYCGVAPFERQSGTSVYRKPSVSRQANLKLKSLLFTAACAAVKAKGELKSYFVRNNTPWKKYPVI
ncbi:MAG: IS110 family transposase [Cyclobacteriaceae bacterium]|nr:IS110 family transposase [Cyclobacteriaceae bacterium]